MDVENIKKYVGKKVEVVLKNTWRFTFIVPEFEGSSFSIIDKFGKPVEIDCDLISLLKELPQ